MNKLNLLTFLSLCIVGVNTPVCSAFLTDSQIEEWEEENGNGAKIVRNFDPEKKTTLGVGFGELEAEYQFFGGAKPYWSSTGGDIWTTNTFQGRIFKDNIDTREKYKIPIRILHDDQQNLIYYFSNNGKELPYTKSEALKYQRRDMESPMEVDPERTIYLNISNVPTPYSFSHSRVEENHIEANIFELKTLPMGLKVEKLVVQDLGNGGMWNTTKAWASFFKNIHTYLKPNGIIYWEIRNNIDENVSRFENNGFQTSLCSNIRPFIPGRFFDSMGISAEFLPKK